MQAKTLLYTKSGTALEITNEAAEVQNLKATQSPSTIVSLKWVFRNYASNGLFIAPFTIELWEIFAIVDIENSEKVNASEEHTDEQVQKIVDDLSEKISVPEEAPTEPTEPTE